MSKLWTVYVGVVPLEGSVRRQITIDEHIEADTQEEAIEKGKVLAVKDYGRVLCPDSDSTFAIELGTRQASWAKDENGKTAKDRFFEGIGKSKDETDMLPTREKDKKENDLERITLSSDQEKAWSRLQVWATNKEPYFTLRGYAGTGKEQPIRCKVQTETGTKSLGKLKVGDKIYGRDGKLTRVDTIYPQGKKDCYKITFRDNVSTYCGLDHLWNIIDKHGRSRVVPLSKLLECPLTNTAGFKYRVPLCNEINYPKKLLPLHPYFLGALLGDGCFRGTTLSLSCASFDLEIMSRIKSKETRFIFTKHTTSENCYQFNVIDSKAYNKDYKTNRFKDIITDLGLYNLKSGDKFIPKDYLLSSIEDRWELLRGLMDTDGCGRKNGGAFFSTTSKRLKRDIRTLVQSLGGMAIVYPLREGRNDYEINIKTFKNPFYLPRKANKWRLSKINLPVRAITKIKYVGKEEQLCIKVSAKDSLYLTDNFIVTHNTFILKMLTSLPVTLYFTAPTNKATKVLSKFVDQPAKTTFSQLGLRMSADDDKLVMEYGAATPYLPRGSILVVDEASMVGKDLCAFIEDTRKRSGCKVLYVGDPVQLPPVGESFSKSWKTVTDKENFCALKKVMRYDNQLLVLATRIRDQIIAKDYSSWPIEDDNDGEKGVFVLNSKKAMVKQLKAYTKPEDFLVRKVIAWRNLVVNEYNDVIRENFGFTDDYNVGDIILIAEPVEKNDEVIAHIDDEFTITGITETEVKTSGDVMVPVYALNIKNEDSTIVINVPIDDEILNEVLTKKAAWAKACKGLARKDAWKDFWDTKKLFCKVRYAYSITAHRSQGSTYLECFVDQQDILSNQNKKEAYRCLYVACTRASENLYTF